MRARTFTVLAGLTASLLLASGLEVYKPVERRHWAFQKRSQPVVPKFTSAVDRAWAKQPIDAFVLSRLEKEELRPAPQASKATLIRRRLLRSDRPAAHACRGRRVRRRHVARSLREAGRQAAGQPALRRALGPALARCRPLRRNRRLRVRHAPQATPGAIATT